MVGERQGTAQKSVRAIKAIQVQPEMAQVLQRPAFAPPGLSTDQCEHPLV